MLSPERRVLSHSWKRVASAAVQLFESSTAKTAVTKRRVAVVSRCTSTVRAKLSERHGWEEYRQLGGVLAFSHLLAAGVGIELAG